MSLRIRVTVSNECASVAALYETTMAILRAAAHEERQRASAPKDGEGKRSSDLKTSEDPKASDIPPILSELLSKHFGKPCFFTLYGDAKYDDSAPKPDWELVVFKADPGADGTISSDWKRDCPSGHVNVPYMEKNASFITMDIFDQWSGIPFIMERKLSKCFWNALALQIIRQRTEKPAEPQTPSGGSEVNPYELPRPVVAVWDQLRALWNDPKDQLRALLAHLTLANHKVKAPDITLL